MYPPELYPGPTIQSRSAARRATKDLVLGNSDDDDVDKKRMRIQIVSLTGCILWFASKDPSPQFYFVFRHQKGDTENLLAAGFILGFAAH